MKLTTKGDCTSNECRHYSFEVDEEAGEVSCEQCEKNLDPIFVLMRLTQLYREQDYKYDKIVEFETQERERAAKRRAKWAAQARRDAERRRQGGVCDA